jgi:DNA polymerase-3 subunit alpha
MNFTHLHVHTEYSLLDGATRIKETCALARKMGMDSLAITDHGNMHGAIAFYEACEANGIKPIIGCEVYVARESRLKKSEGTNDRPYHLVLLAETDRGYKNLLKVVSCGYLEGFYYKPRVDLEVLSEHSEGLLALTACVEGEVPHHLGLGDQKRAQQALGRYLDVFGKDNLYIEVQRNGVPGQEQVNRALADMAKRNGLPLVATNDCHYITRDDAKYHDVLLAIQTGTNIKDPKRLRFSGSDFYLRSPDEMSELFKDVPHAVANTLTIARRCNAGPGLGQIHLPEFPLEPGESAESRLRQMALGGLRKRLGGRNDGVRDERLEYELAMIEKMGYSSYFLIVSDFVDYAKRSGIAVGPGRGSAAGSLVAYALGITNIDPIEYELVFERFLNPERVSMPDIDIDFQDDRRDEVIEYVKRKYGEDRVAQIITFGTMAARGAVRDAGRATAVPYSEVDRIAKMIPQQVGMTIDKAIEMVPALREVQSRPEAKDLLETARKLEGMPRHSSTHAAGIVIGKGPLWDYVPLARAQEGGVVTQYPMEDLEALGLLKMDFLALRTLTVIQKTGDIIHMNGDVGFKLEEIPLDDRETFAMLSRGEAIGIFQLEASWVRDFLKEMKPGRLQDIIATVALCRPGPMEQIPEFLGSRTGTPHYLHPVLKPVLEETHGVLVYQEQILRVAHVVAGFSLGEADILRRAVGKKKKELLDQMEDRFLKGASHKGIPVQTARAIYDLIQKFANYGFSKNHAAPYALIAYQTAYLKANHAKAFMAALLSSVAGIQGKVGLYLEEAKRLGLSVLGPSVNKSSVEFSVEGQGIRFGLGSIKNVGGHLASAIVDERENGGAYGSLADLAMRIEGRYLNKKGLESLIQSGACDDLGTRYANLEGMDGALRMRNLSSENQPSLFDEIPAQPVLLQAGLFGDEPSRARVSSSEEIALDVRLQWERELLGMYFSGHPLSKYKELLREKTTPIPDLEFVHDGRDAVIGGRVSSLKKVVTRSGEEMAFVNIEDDYDTIEVIVFPRTWQKYRSLLVKEKVVLVRGSLEEQEEARRILAREVLEADLLVVSGHNP